MEMAKALIQVKDSNFCGITMTTALKRSRVQVQTMKQGKQLFTSCRWSLWPVSGLPGQPGSSASVLTQYVCPVKAVLLSSKQAILGMPNV